MYYYIYAIFFFLFNDFTKAGIGLHQIWEEPHPSINVKIQEASVAHHTNSEV